jgi:hypothetical protein
MEGVALCRGGMRGSGGSIEIEISGPVDVVVGGGEGVGSVTG